jgi:hypothetical protein
MSFVNRGGLILAASGLLALVAPAPAAAQVIAQRAPAPGWTSCRALSACAPR